jgi:hypothetical protein
MLALFHARPLFSSSYPGRVFASYLKSLLLTAVSHLTTHDSPFTQDYAFVTVDVWSTQNSFQRTLQQSSMAVLFEIAGLNQSAARITTSYSAIEIDVNS